MARFDYNSILCYVRGLWLRVAKFSISKPQRTGQGGERKKDARQSEPIGDGKYTINANDVMESIKLISKRRQKVW